MAAFAKVRIPIRQAPAFQLYASDLIADERYRLMSLAERGLYLSMQAQAWVGRTIPSEPDQLARVIGAEAAAVREALTDRVLAFFERAPGGGDRLRSPELDAYREQLDARRAERSRSGKKGASIRRERAATASSVGANLEAEPSRATRLVPERNRSGLSRDESSSPVIRFQSDAVERERRQKLLDKEIIEAFGDEPAEYRKK